MEQNVEHIKQLVILAKIKGEVDALRGVVEGSIQTIKRTRQVVSLDLLKSMRYLAADVAKTIDEYVQSNKMERY